MEEPRLIKPGHHGKIYDVGNGKAMKLLHCEGGFRPQYEDMRREFHMHDLFRDCAEGLSIGVPKAYCAAKNGRDIVMKYGQAHVDERFHKKISTLPKFQSPCMILERLPPIGEELRMELVEKGQHYSDEVSHKIWDFAIGLRDMDAAEFFVRPTILGSDLHLLNLNLSLQDVSQSLGKLLGRAVFQKHVGFSDVEIVFSGNRVLCIDFGSCFRLDSHPTDSRSAADRIVADFEHMDSYLPRPDQACRLDFETGFYEAAADVGAIAFMKEVCRKAGLFHALTMASDS